MFFCDFPGFRVDALAKVDAEIKRLAEKRRFDAAATACIQWIPRVRDATLYFDYYVNVEVKWFIMVLISSWNIFLFSIWQVKYNFIFNL